MVIRLGIIGVSLLSSVIFFDRLRLYDLVIGAALVYFLFFAKIEG